MARQLLGRLWIPVLTFLLCVSRALTLDGSEGDSVSPQVTFLSHPSNYPVQEGNSVLIECKVEGFGENTLIIWQGNQSGNVSSISMGSMGVAPNKQDRFSVVRDPEVGEHLSISAVRLGDEGTYTCEVFGRSPTQTHRLVVTIPPRITSMTPDSFISLKEGQSLQFECLAEGKPTPTITWGRTGDTLPNGSHSQQGEVLLFPSVTKDYAGEYFCLADNGVGTPETAFVSVAVKYAPTVEVEKNPVYTGMGLVTVSLICTISALPAVELVWKHNGSMIDFDERTTLHQLVNEGGRHILQINSIRPHDLGEYECVSGNSLGQATGTISLKAEPHDLVILSDGAAPYSDQYTLKWNIHSREQLVEFEMEIKQLEEGVESVWESMTIPAPLIHSRPEHQQEYTIEQLPPATAFTLRLRGRNTFGYSHWTKDFNFTTNTEGNAAPLPTTKRPGEQIGNSHYTEPADNTVSYDVGQNTDGGAGLASFRMTIILGLVLQYVFILSLH